MVPDGPEPERSEDVPSESTAACELDRLRARVRDLEARSASLRTLFDNLPIGLFSMEDPARGTIDEANPALARMLGLPSREAVLRLNASATYADPKERQETFARFLADPEFRRTGVCKFETVRLRQDTGRPFPVIITVYATFDAEGRIVRFDCAMEDLTERQRAERSFAASEERFRGLFESAVVGVALTDMNGRFTRANPAFCRMLERPEAELVGRHCDELLAEGEAPLLGPTPGPGGALQIAAIARAFAARDRGKVWGYAAVSWLADAEGRPFQAAVIVQDITAHKRLEDELVRVQKLESLAVLAGGIAHDFNNFLAAILGNVSLALLRPDQANEEYLVATRDAALRAREVTQQLLTFARGGDPVKQAASLLELAREAAAFCLRGTGIAVDFAASEPAPLAEVDPGQLAQVFHNLFINAREALPGGGRVEVRVDEVEIALGDPRPLHAGHYVRVAVRDGGEGIPAEHLDRIFEPYFTTKQRGSGLGLASVYAIVKRHGGHVEARSEPGVGATFTVYLPATATAAPERVEVATDAPSARRSGRILAMDDEPAVRQVLHAMLTEAGYEVELVSDGARALGAWQVARALGRPFALVILDLTVREGLGGEATMRRLRELDPGVRAIVSSGYAENPVLATHAAHGFAARVVKPYTYAQLLAAIDEALHPPPPRAAGGTAP
ncbi:MAG: PAS domain S-box protein [Polyangiaceae bacterium]|nr:PAS domain S-box protein [Polyangiaceae bacterium]